MKLSILIIFVFPFLLACSTKNVELTPEQEQWPVKNREDIRKVILTKKNDLKPCFTEYLKKHPGVKDSDINLKITWIIDVAGIPRKFTQDSSSTKDDALFNCVSDKMSRWVFPAPPDKAVAEIEYPFYFRDGEVKSKNELAPIK